MNLTCPESKLALPRAIYLSLPLFVVVVLVVVFDFVLALLLFFRVCFPFFALFSKSRGNAGKVLRRDGSEVIRDDDINTTRLRCIAVVCSLSQVFFRVSMALLDLSQEHLMSLDLDGTVE